ncbi:integrin beta-7 isoform X1 [Ornithorhynchus anatinus]|uniref:integrin beta-7 isoform X1 n=1 Tax=Ornithorhynchus anatinus TaxID=9258 RepID=UPI0010A935CE|nr:integrin beta-7 isoform X1 [Ornithorhynchus anatinus]
MSLPLLSAKNGGRRGSGRRKVTVPQAMTPGAAALAFGLLLGLGSSEVDREEKAAPRSLEEGDPKARVRFPDSCPPASSCRECILAHPSCAWCKQLDFQAAEESVGRRCAVRAELLSRGCRAEELQEPRGQVHVLRDWTLGQDPGPAARAGAAGPEEGQARQPTQLAPQKVRILLRPGEEQRLNVSFRRAEGYPVDLYYLMDLSYSMKDDLDHVRRLGDQLLNGLAEVKGSVRIGFGSFVDKTVLPFVSTVPAKLRHPCPDRLEQCQPPFSFRHVLPLTANASEFELEVGRQSVSGNLDAPEGGFDAILQAALCQKQIGWRNVSRLLVFTSDDTFHMAGDGKLGGIYMPSDGHCHLDAQGFYHRSHDFDYPSVGQVAQVLSDANIQPIFAVTATTLPVYQELSKLIPKSAVGELNENSSNVVDLIKNAYNNLSSTVTLEHLDLPPGVHISYESRCEGSEGTGTTRGECRNVQINQTVQFTVTVRADGCVEHGHTVRVRALGFMEELHLVLEPVCDCACGDPEPYAPHCGQGNGSLHCGVCSCYPGHLGPLCECSAGLSEPAAGCRGHNGTGPVCSGQGRCQCGRCRCHGQAWGQFCQCHDESCERHEGRLCAGFGRCRCGRCICQANYTGSACQCSLDTAACAGPDGQLCGGHGRCRCNQCECAPGYFGHLCERCPGCRTLCERFRDCADCGAFGKGPLSANCSLACPNVTVTLSPPSPNDLQQDGWCKEPAANHDDQHNRLLFFRVEGDQGGGAIRLLVRLPDAGPDRARDIALGCVGGIVAVGLALAVAYRLSVNFYDLREFRRFEKEQMQSTWSPENNPLYRSAVTTVVNPYFQNSTGDSPAASASSPAPGRPLS